MRHTISPLLAASHRYASLQPVRRRTRSARMSFIGPTGLASRASVRRRRARRQASRASCFTTFAARPCARSNAPACHALPRWRWLATSRMSIYGRYAIVDEQMHRKRPRSWTRGAMSNRPRPMPHARGRCSGSRSGKRHVRKLRKMRQLLRGLRGRMRGNFLICANDR
jgi:hypothetical protein